ncbi:hypothetical protein M5K25_026430 [Dendrobium thyrsiflorum]|uniref:Uncharacterized protein n=1 Tax=Dendrobium thyrsiflorum TaxID=117978 RepID=A0ABD0TXF4_DENTH
MVGARGHRGRKSFFIPPRKEIRVWGLQVYLSERGAVVSPQAGTYEYPFLAVGAAPVSHPTALEKSAYRRFAGPSRTPKKRLLDHPLRHKHRDALPSTTWLTGSTLTSRTNTRVRELVSSRGFLRSKCRNVRSERKGKSAGERSRTATKGAGWRRRRRRRTNSRQAPVVLPIKLSQLPIRLEEVVERAKPNSGGEGGSRPKKRTRGRKLNNNVGGATPNNDEGVVVELPSLLSIKLS